MPFVDFSFPIPILLIFLIFSFSLTRFMAGVRNIAAAAAQIQNAVTVGQAG